MAPSLRLAEILELDRRAEVAVGWVRRMTGRFRPVESVAPEDVPILAAIVLVPPPLLTAEALTRGLLHLARAPELADTLNADPDRVRPFLHESLRLDPPQIRTMHQYATTSGDAPPDLLAAPRARGLCDIARANRDPARFPSPGEMQLDARRPPDLTFGSGPHRCPGAGLSMRVLEEVLRVAAGGFRLGPPGEMHTRMGSGGLRHISVPLRIRRRDTP